jgi:C4-dicarboxylate transporter DctM subunit
MILYGALLELNVATLFAAGLIPGLITGGLLCVTITLLMRKKEVSPLPPEAKKAKRRIFINALPTLIMPIIVLGGIYGGVFTPTEAAAVGTVYTIIVGFLIYRELNLKKLWKSLTDSLVIISSIFLLGAGAILIGRMFVLAGVPQAMSEFVVRANLSAASFLVLACGMMLVMGVFIEVLIILLVFVPIVYPSVLMLGINPIYFGIIVVISLLIGQATPPVATNLYASSLICNVPPQETARGITPFTLTLIVSLVITVAFPGLSLWLPRILGLPIK